MEPKILSAEEIQEQHHWLIDGNTGVIPNNCLRCINKTAKAQLAKDIEWHTEEVEREVNNALLKQYETFEARIPARIAEARAKLIEEIEEWLQEFELIDKSCSDELCSQIMDTEDCDEYKRGLGSNLFTPRVCYWRAWQQVKQKYQKEG